MDGSKSSAIGNVAEIDVVELIQTIPFVTKAWRDLNNNKTSDIYYILQDETVTRSLQVKAIGIDSSRPSSPSYKMYHLDKYENGTLIIGSNKKEQLGVAYIKEDKYHRSTATMSLGISRGGRFSGLLLDWDDFKERLEHLLPFGMIINEEDLAESVAPTMLLSIQSIARFIVFCNKFGYSYEEVSDTSSRTDLIFEGMKAQFKFASQLPNTGSGHYSYHVTLGKSGIKSKLIKRKIPYCKGDNDIYIIELSTHLGDFLFLPESLLISKDFIKTNTNPGKTSLNVFPYDYIEIANIDRPESSHLNRGNWTCDKSLWLSTTKGEIK
jgi:hypothetical protein